MKTQPVHFGAALALLLTTAAAQADHFDPYRLEPGINGGVSATGRFASQGEENARMDRLAVG